MGLTWSSAVPEEGENVISESPETLVESEASGIPAESEKAEETDEDRRKRREEELIKFRDDLAAKRDLRRKKLGEVSDELKGLRDLLQQEIARRHELEQELIRYRGVEAKSTDRRDVESRVAAGVESLRISKYDDDDDDEIDILDEEDEPRSAKDEIAEDAAKNKRKGIKKKVSFSLDLVKEEEFDPQETVLRGTVEVAEEAAKRENVSSDNTDVDGKPSEEDQGQVDKMKQLTEQNKKLENQVKALKDVANLSKQLLGLRESQVEELNDKLTKVEGQEKDYERKMTAMKELRRLYDERGRAMLIEHKNQIEKERTKITILESKLRFAEDINEDLADKNKHLEEKVKNLDNQLDSVRAQLSETKIKLATEKEGLYHASSQISLINNLVSQIISGPELDLDHLARFLEENHSLINELTAKGDIDYVASALVGVAGGIVEVPKEEKSDIAENLGKVWRVLIELLSHHKKTESNTSQEWESCYKSVDTPKGPKLVISVSQTFLKLKDLILEKNSLVKEVGRLKKLNGHLEKRMEEQGGRLSLVTEELHNTWDVVNKLKRQHDNLHTHERILKHELQHKRSMLNGLKKQLEICREQWDLAREKNSKTENDWMLLRAEFAMRKQKKKFFNSAESGYEDEETQSPEYDTDEDKSLEIEEESPENSVGEHLNQPGSVSPSDISTSDSNSMMDECNGPISEILDGIFEEAYNIAKTSKNTNKIQQNTTGLTEEHQTNGIVVVTVDTDAESENIIVTQLPSERISYASICDINVKRLEQIPEVEEDVSNDNSLKESENNELDDENKDKLQIISVTNLKSGSSTQIEPNAVNVKKEMLKTNDGQSEKDNTNENNGETEQNKSNSLDNHEKSVTSSLTTEEILQRREERLKRMEESCKSLFIQMGQTSNRGNAISNKLDQIHATYGPLQSNDSQSTSLKQVENNLSSSSDVQQNQTESQVNIEQSNEQP